MGFGYAESHSKPFSDAWYAARVFGAIYMIEMESKEFTCEMRLNFRR